jgi:ABC-type cobalamin transport system ATPase subunit
MPPPWKLVVEDLGRIGHAEIEARPLLLFVGENNTGKTYLASLMWGLLSLSGRFEIAQGDAHRRCVAWIEERFARRAQEQTFELTPEVHADLVQIVNDTLKEEGTALAESTFNRAGFEVGNIQLRDVAHRGSATLGWIDFQSDVDVWLSIPQDSWRVPARTLSERAALVGVLAWYHALGGLPAIQTLRYVTFSRDHDPLVPIFLPASRTGFMLQYRSLAQQLVGDALVRTGPRPPGLDLTTPAIEFLKLLVGLRPGKGGFDDEAELLQSAIGGHITLRSDIGLPEVLYEHTQGEPPLPMELSSALVTELAPLVLILHHVSGYRVLIIEEPEIHLHPHLQRVLAQVIVRLVRKGLYVWITTHSENFCQQINNFLKIGALPADKRAEAQAKLGYAEKDYLDLDDVGGYEFRVEGSRTVVDEMRKTPKGLVMPSFNRELFALAKEIDYLDDLAGEGK